MKCKKEEAKTKVDEHDVKDMFPLRGNCMTEPGFGVQSWWPDAERTADAAMALRLRSRCPSRWEQTPVILKSALKESAKTRQVALRVLIVIGKR